MGKEAETRNLVLGKYEMGRVLGKGTFAKVYLGRDLRTGESVAIKVIHKDRIRREAGMVEQIEREISVMRIVRHHHVVELREVMATRSRIFFVMEYVRGGELFARVARGALPEDQARRYFRQLISAVDCCHRRGVSHRDLKPENFLFGDSKENAPLKSIDFGLSQFFRPGERFTEIVGSPYYMAPEVLLRNYGPEVDVWSSGVILYILLSGAPPFWGETEHGVAEAIIRSVVDFKRDPWPKVSDYAKDLVRRMLERDPNKRLTAQQVLDHPWLQNGKKTPNVDLGENVRARFQQFSMMNKFKNKALKVMAEHLSVEEVADIKDMFESMDIDDKGKITLEEFKYGLQKLGHLVPDSDVKRLMKAAGVDGNDTLDYGEFVAISIHLKRIGNDGHLREAFRYFDQDDNGYIEIEELRGCLADDLGPNPDEVIYAIIHNVDTDKDGKISYEEFATMMKAGTDWRKASRQYSRERFTSLSSKLAKDGWMFASTGKLS